MVDQITVALPGCVGTVGRVKLLLTSAGVRNDSIRDRLVEMLGKPISECDALAIPPPGTGTGTCSPSGRGSSSAVTATAR